MVAVRTEDAAARRRVLSAFRSQSQRGFTGPEATHRTHPHGWGIAGVGLEGPFLLGRSGREASSDAEYDVAVGRAKEVEADGWVLAHVRNASVGDVHERNSQPFVRDGWAFCHNGTIYDLDAPEGVLPEGTTDSEAFFLHLLGAIRDHGDVREAIEATVHSLVQTHRHSSLTFLLTDGHDLYAFRHVGPDHKFIPTLDEAFAHYTLGWGTAGGAFVVTQEPQFLGEVAGWSEVPDGYLLHVPAHGTPRLSPIVGASVTQLRPVARMTA